MMTKTCLFMSWMKILQLALAKDFLEVSRSMYEIILLYCDIFMFHSVNEKQQCSNMVGWPWFFGLFGLSRTIFMIVDGSVIQFSRLRCFLKKYYPVLSQDSTFWGLTNTFSYSQLAIYDFFPPVQGKLCGSIKWVEYRLKITVKR